MIIRHCKEIICFILVAIIFVALFRCGHARAGELNSVGVEFAAGAYLMSSISDPMIYRTYNTGSHNVGTLDLHLVMEFDDAPLHEVRVGWHHQSYINRGWPMNDRPETYIDAIGIELVWRHELWSK